ncbi:MAG: YidB family protein [Rubrivivax sp.]
MGLLDAVIGSLGPGARDTGGQPSLQAQLIQAVLQMLMQPQAGATAGGGLGGHPTGSAMPGGLGGGLGGLGGLIGMLQQAGLGDAASSWVSGGPNRSVSPDQVHAALGDERMSELASRLGIGTPQVASELSQVLPQMVDRMTPQGQLPSDGGMPDLGQLGELLGGLLGRR